MFCAIDFGTSNSAIAIPAAPLHAGDSPRPGDGRAAPAMRLVELEAGHTTMPTAVFYFAEDTPGAEGRPGPPRAFGRAAVEAYVDGLDGRLMRSMKSILGSPLIDQTTDVGGGRGATYRDIVGGYLAHLKHRAEAESGGPIERAVLGRPVFFVDGDPARDALAQAALEAAARQVGFKELHFQYEPIAAALDFERGTDREQTVLVIDIGGGTSDFSVVRVGPERRDRLDRHDDILANHGVHVAGTDFDRRIELAAILPAYGYGARSPATGRAEPREVPSGVYFDLATWHLINTVYQPGRVAELRGMRRFYAEPRHHERLMTVLSERLGHDLAARAEQAKIDTAAGAGTRIDLGLTERGLGVDLNEREAAQATEADVERIVDAALEAVRQAGLTGRSGGTGRPADHAIDALYFTGGSTGMRRLADRIGAAFPGAAVVRGDRFGSVATGLGLYARRVFGG